LSTEPVCRLLEWDSAFFGCRVARATPTRLDEAGLAAIMRWCQAEAIDWLYFLGDPNHRETPRLAQAAGFDFVDFRLELVCPVDARQTAPTPPAPIVIRPATRADLPDLCRLAADAYRDTRFFFDRHVDETRAPALYARWIERSVVDQLADFVLAAEWEGQTVGHITGKLGPGPAGSIGLLAVDAAMRGHGLGSRLLEAGLAWLAQHGAVQVDLVTQGRNTSAQRLYQRHGFVTQATWLWYHHWFTR